MDASLESRSSKTRASRTSSGRTSSSERELAYERAVAEAAVFHMQNLQDAGPDAIREYQRQLRELDAFRPLPVDVRLEPNYMTDAAADGERRRVRRLEVIGTDSPLMLTAFRKALNKAARGADIHPACVRIAVVAAGMDPEAALATMDAPPRTFRSERLSLGSPLPLSGRRHLVSAVGAVPRLVGGKDDRYVPDPRLRSWMGRVTRFGYKPEFNPRRRRRIRNLGKDRYLFRLVESTNARLWDPVMARMHEDRDSPVGKGRNWGCIFPRQLRTQTPAKLEPAARQLVQELCRPGSSRLVGMAAIPGHALAFEAHLSAARRAFYGNYGVRLTLTLMDPNAGDNVRPASMETLRRALEAAIRHVGLMAPPQARAVDIRRGKLGVVFVDRLAPPVQVKLCRVRNRRLRIQAHEPSCGPSSFALMLAAARLIGQGAKEGGGPFCTRAYSAVGDEDVVIAAQMYRQA